MPRLAVLLVCALSFVPAAADASHGRQAAVSAPAPSSVEAQRAFLETAKVVSSRPIGKGITGAMRVTLSDGVITHDAAFQSIATEPIVDGKKRAGEFRFADHYRYNIAAWRLATLLGLGHMMPTTIERRINGKTGALSWWVDDVLMDEGEREAKNVQPPNALAFARDRQRMNAFAELVRDMDRNKGNVVYTADWRHVMLDFTRAFRLDTKLRDEKLDRCDRALYAALQGLTRDAVGRAVGDSLRSEEIRAVMTRRDLMVQHFARLIAERGEAAVLF